MENNKAVTPVNKKWGVMDLGTNTFHLLIVEGHGNDFREVVHLQEPVKIGEGGINKGLIQPAAFERGLSTMQHFRGLLQQHNVTVFKAIATSAMRSAANGQQFIDDVKAQTGIAIEIINGDEEAAYIYQGIKAAGCLAEKNSLIVDIGGGSVEFIICNGNGILWKQSFEIGAARLMDKFHRTDPIPPESITALTLYLQEGLSDLLAANSKYTIENMIGSSGVFETYAGLIEAEKGNDFDLNVTKHYDFDIDALVMVTEKIIQTSHQQRLGLQVIPPVRIDMIVTASVLTRFIIEKLDLENVEMSTSSLKEGVLAGMMD